jgi:phosphoribosyl-AMP cyclohydrolase|tara:strand:+ start:509 stop:982 length:474 start_codon:yes stop_codon:yes gene_type:complete
VNKIIFAKRESVEQVEEGNILAPKFDQNGIIPAVVTEASSGELLMLGYMNKESLRKTIETKEAYYWSRSREVLWKKGDSSGMIHEVEEILIDDDQDSLWLKVSIKGLGASCHVGYKSCFYRSLQNVTEDGVELKFTENEKVFDPEVVYPGTENPTKL